MARARGQSVYLEIGSHLGGSLQPHLLDERCVRAYSIDPRPRQQPDERAPGHVAVYADNSTEGMLSMLSSVQGVQLSKLTCFECDASELSLAELQDRPDLALIDGEHTKRAVLSDFGFCLQVLASRGAVLFHDVGIVHPAIRTARGQLRRAGIAHEGVKVDGGLYGIFLDSSVLWNDPHLRRMAKRNRFYTQRRLARQVLEWAKELLGS